MKNIFIICALLFLAGSLRAQPHVIIGPKNLLPAQTSADSLKFPQADGHGGTSWQTAASAVPATKDTLTGDVTGNGSGSFATAIGSQKVTTAMLKDTNVTLGKLAHSGVTQTVLLGDTSAYTDAVKLTLPDFTRSHDTLSLSVASATTLSNGNNESFSTTPRWQALMGLNSGGARVDDVTDVSNFDMSYATYMATAGTLKNLRALVDNAPGSSKGDTITIYKNGVAQSLKIIFSGSDTTKLDNTHTVSYAAGDLLAYRFVKSTGSSTTDAAITLESDANSTLTSANFSGTSSGTNTGDVTLAGAGTYLTISGQQITQNAITIKNFYSFAIEGVTQGRYYNPFQDINGGNTGTSSDPTDTTNGTIDWAWVIPKGGGTIKNLKIVTSGSPRGTDSVIAKFIKNGSATTLKATVKTGSNIADDQTHSISAVENDLVSVFFNYLSANGYVRYLTVTFEFDPNLFIHYYTGFREAMKGSHDVYEEILY